MKLLKHEDGAAMVEFALVITILLLIVFGIIEFGRIFHAHLVVTHAAREGARVGVVTDSANRDSQIRATVINRGSSLGLTAGNVSTTSSGDTVTVTVNYSVDLVAPFISSIVNDPFPVSGDAVMRIE